MNILKKLQKLFNIPGSGGGMKYLDKLIIFYTDKKKYIKRFKTPQKYNLA